MYFELLTFLKYFVLLSNFFFYTFYFTYLIVDGQWSIWGDYDTCTLTCGGGTQSAKRVCNNPPPKFGGADCVGISSNVRSCNILPCPGNHFLQ